MKTLFALAAIAASMNAQPAAKPAMDTKGTPPLAPTERSLTDDEVLRLSLVTSQIEVLRAKFGIAELEKKYQEFQAALAPIITRQEAVAKPACVSVGVPESDIKNGGCGISVGVDSAGNVINGQDGKPIASRVWHETKKAQMPALPAVDAKTTDKK